MVGIGIAGILATVAVPSFNNLIASQRVRSTATEIFVALLKGRSEAIMRNASVTLSPKASGWNSGWQIPDPANAANILEDHGATGDVAITGPASVTYRSSGRVQAGAAPQFVISATSGSTTSYRCVSIDLSGRPLIQAASSC
jgi:type IV fimbrial biogenesis protein FimT